MRYKFVLVALLCSSCATHRMVETDLYFGLNKPGGGKVTDQEWADFNKKHISIVFSDGSTILDASGSWRNPKTNQFITEPSRVVICLHKDDVQVSARIDSLREQYKKLFMQQSVLRVDKEADVSF